MPKSIIQIGEDAFGKCKCFVSSSNDFAEAEKTSEKENRCNPTETSVSNATSVYKKMSFDDVEANPVLRYNEPTWHETYGNNNLLYEYDEAIKYGYDYDYESSDGYVFHDTNRESYYDEVDSYDREDREFRGGKFHWD